MKSRIATYLQRLSEVEYQVPTPISNAVNYIIDSWFKKADDRANAYKVNRPWMPDDPATHIQEEWLGCEILKAISLNQTYPTFARSMHAWAFTRLFKEYAGANAEYNSVPFLDQYKFKELLKGNRLFQHQHEQIAIDLNSAVTLPVYGLFFVQHPTKKVNLIVRIDLCYDYPACTIKVLSRPEDQKAAEEFLQDFATSCTQNDIYFKKCLTFIKGHLDFVGIINTTWDDIIIKDNIKSQVRDNSIVVLDNMEQLVNLGMCPNRNTILISPPGMAKTTMFRAVSNEVSDRATRIWCTGKSIEYAEHVTSLFEAARVLAPCIIFLEDLDLFTRDRDGLHGYESGVLNEFLACLDGMKDNAGVIVMASTNSAASLDEAVLDRPGRFSVKIEVPFPDFEDRSLMLHSFFQKLHAIPDPSVTRDSMKTILELCDGLTGDYIKELAKCTVLRSVAEGRASGNKVIFTADDLNAAGEQVVRNFKIGKRAKKHIENADKPELQK